MPVLRIGGQARRSQGRRNRHSLARNGGFENAASGDEWSSRRAACVFPHPASWAGQVQRPSGVTPRRHSGRRCTRSIRWAPASAVPTAVMSRR